MKKRIVLIIFGILLLISGSVLSVYFISTLSPLACKQFCINNTARNATSFSPRKDGRYINDYIYWIAADGDAEKPQEIFVFKEKSLGPFHLNRYQFVLCSNNLISADTNNKVGSLLFFTRNDKHEKESNATLMFFGSRLDADITTYEYKLTVKEGSNIYKGRINNKDSDTWFLKFTDFGTIFNSSKIEISEIKFYDADNRLIFTY